MGKYIRDNGLCSSPTPVIATMSGHKKLYIKQGADGTVEKRDSRHGIARNRASSTLSPHLAETSP